MLHLRHRDCLQDFCLRVFHLFKFSSSGFRVPSLVSWFVLTIYRASLQSALESLNSKPGTRNFLADELVEQHYYEKQQKQNSGNKHEPQIGVVSSFVQDNVRNLAHLPGTIHHIAFYVAGQRGGALNLRSNGSPR